MQNTKRIKNTMMFILCIIVCIMSIAYAVLATNLVSLKENKKISDDSNIPNNSDKSNNSNGSRGSKGSNKSNGSNNSRNSNYSRNGNIPNSSNNLYWKVGILDITEAGIVGEAKSITPPTNTSSTATFNVSLKKPGDSMTYKVTVRNSGQLNAKVHSVYAVTTGTKDIEYKLSGIKAGDKLAVGKEDELYIKITCKNIGSSNENKSRNITVIMNYIQDL